MAEAHNLKLVISADTSDAEKKLKDVGNTKVPAIKVDVVAEKVKVDAPKVDPVKVPVSADKISIDAPKVDPVKVPVIEEPVSVGADPRAARDPIKVPVEVDEVKVDAPKVDPVKVPVEVETPTVTANVETPVISPKVETPAPVKATVIEPAPVTPKVNTPKPVELTVGIKDEEAKRRLAEITSLHEIPCKPVGVSARDGEKFLIEFQPDDTKVVNALREVTAQEHVVIVGMRAKYQDAQRLYKELSTPVEKPVKVVEKREPAPSVDHKAESVRVTEKRDPPKEVKHPDETVNVHERRFTSVQKHDLHANDEALKRSRELVAATNDVGTAAETSAKRARNAFFSTSSAINRMYYALHAFQRLASGLTIFATIAIITKAFQSLKAKIEEVTTRAARLAFALEMKSAASETDRLCSSHERLAKLLKDELDTLSKQKAVRAIKENGEQDLEDGRRAANRARQIYEAKTPEEEQALRDKFAVEDEQIARSRRQKTRETQIKDLDWEDNSYTAKANGLRERNAEIDKQLEVERLNVKRAANPRIRRGEGEENASEEEKAARARVKALEETKKANDAQIAEWEREAKFRREQIAALQGVKDYDGESAASLAAKQREKEKARENDKATTEADSDWRERRERERKKKEVAEAVDAQGDNTGNKKAILDAQADNAQAEADALRKQYEVEMKKSASVRDAAKLADLRAKIDERESTADSYRDQSKEITVDENTKRADDLESYAQRIASADGVSKNRLTAMGLDSGVSGKGRLQSELSNIISLLREQISATKENKPVQPSGFSIYSE